MEKFFIYAINYSEAMSIAKDYLSSDADWQYLWDPFGLIQFGFDITILIGKNYKERDDWYELYQILISDKQGLNRFNLRWL